MSRGDCTVKFRGIEREVYYTVDINYICWAFHGLTAPAHEQLVVTDAEDEDICRQVREYEAFKYSVYERRG